MKWIEDGTTTATIDVHDPVPLLVHCLINVGTTRIHVRGHLTETRGRTKIGEKTGNETVIMNGAHEVGAGRDTETEDGDLAPVPAPPPRRTIVMTSVKRGGRISIGKGVGVEIGIGKKRRNPRRIRRVYTPTFCSRHT